MIKFFKKFFKNVGKKEVLNGLLCIIIESSYYFSYLFVRILIQGFKPNNRKDSLY